MNNIRYLKDVSEVITKGTTPTTVGGVFTDKGINFVKSESISDSKYLNSSVFMKIDEETDEKLKRSRLQEGDLLFSIAGAYLGKISIVRAEDLPANTNQAVGIVRLNKELVDVSYLYYFFSQTQINAYINKLSAQSSQPNLNLDLLGRLSFNYLALEKQKKISSILSAIDSKIELNNRINAELEEMAKTLYDYWFVQFDFPFDFAQGKPDANGKPYKSSGGKMVYNSFLKREIPEGWVVELLTNSCQVIDCLHSKKPDYQFEASACYLLQLENILDNGQIDISNKYFISKSDYDEWTTRVEVKEHDVVMTNAGRIAAFAQIPEGVVCGIGRNITAIRPDTISPNYFFLSLASLDVQRQILTNLDHGAFFKSFNVKGIKALKLLRPIQTIEKEFEESARPMIKMRNKLKQENQSLSKLRDWLLPMLMNGQVTVQSTTSD